MAEACSYSGVLICIENKCYHELASAAIRAGVFFLPRTLAFYKAGQTKKYRGAVFF